MTTRSNITTPATCLLDYLLDTRKLKNDAALARTLEVAHPVISKIRYNRMGLSAAMMIRIHEKCGMTIENIKTFLTHAEQA